MDFDDVIAPLARTSFLSEHWGKSFLRLEGRRGRFIDLLTWADLSRILEQHRLTPPRIRLAQDGKPLEPGRYMATGIGGSPRIDGGKMVACLAAGATLIVECVEELAPRVRDLSDAFREVLRAGNYVNLYAGWRSQNGFDLHWDSQDTVILQLSGRKRWQVFRPTRLHPLERDVEAPPTPTEPPVWDGVLEDGDAIYIPRGWWHMAYPLDEPSLHLTFATVPPNGADLLDWIVSGLRREVDVRKDLPMPGDIEGQRAYVERLRDLVLGAMGDGTVADFRREFDGDSVPRLHIRLPDAPYEQFSEIGAGVAIRLSAAHRLSFLANGEHAEFFAGGVTCVAPVDLIPALERLTDVEAVPYEELTARLQSEAAVADLKSSLKTLAQAGIVLVERSGAPPP